MNQTIQQLKAVLSKSRSMTGIIIRIIALLVFIVLLASSGTLVMGEVVDMKRLCLLLFVAFAAILASMAAFPTARQCISIELLGTPAFDFPDGTVFVRAHGHSTSFRLDRQRPSKSVRLGSLSCPCLIYLPDGKGGFTTNGYSFRILFCDFDLLWMGKIEKHFDEGKALRLDLTNSNYLQPCDKPSLTINLDEV